jgi:hypothetical protein
MSVRMRGRVVSVLVALAVMLTGGLRQAPVNAHTDSHAKVRIGTACVMDRLPDGSTIQTCR